MSRKSIAIIVLLAAALGIAGFGYWLTRSDAGRDFVLRQAQGSLPAGSRLQWKSVSGQLAGGLQFEQLVYADATQRFEAGNIELSMRLSPLLFGNLHIDAVRAFAPQALVAFDTVDLHFLRSERQAELDSSALTRAAARVEPAVEQQQRGAHGYA